MPVAIYELDRAFSFWVWLCETHLARRLAMGFLRKARKDAPHEGLTCLDCHFGEPTTTTETQGANDGSRI